jgi:hypothetical protein
MALKKSQLWEAALRVSRITIQNRGRGLLYSSLVALQCFRYSVRYVFFKLFSGFPRMKRFLMHRVISRSFLENRMIGLMRDLGQEPKALFLDDAILQDLVVLADDGGDEVFRRAIFGALSQLNGDPQQAFDFLTRMLKEAGKALPPELLKGGFYGKVIRTVAGVVGYCYYQDKKYPLMRAVEIGCSFGFLYLYDEALDTPGLVSRGEMAWMKRMVAAFMRNDADFFKKEIPPGDFSRILVNAALRLAKLCPRSQYPDFYTCLAVLAEAQEAEFSEKNSGNLERMYSLVAIKSAMTRLIPAALVGWGITERYVHYTMTIGLANQILDDLRDMPEDVKNSTPTPFVKYLRGEIKAHPLEMYFSAIELSLGYFSRSRLLIRFLWSVRMTHILRVLALKASEAGFNPPLGAFWGAYTAILRVQDKVIVDVEMRLARSATDFVGGLIGKRVSTISH